MSTTGQSEAAQSSRKRGSSACLPLIDAATKDLFRKNAFRITGLSVDATAREEARHNDKIKQLAELGKDPHTQDAAFPIKPPPGLDDIREAIQKLNDPQKRLIDEFFWFWPQEHGQSKSDPAIQALAKGDSKTAIEIWNGKEESSTDGVVASHNLALVYHIIALDWENYSFKNEVESERRQKITNYWKGAFKRWERLVNDEQFWDKVTNRIRQLNEPNLQPGFARQMRASLPEALDKINAELAVAFAESGKIETARLHIRLMRETRQGHDNVEKVAELVLSPARNRIKEQIQRAKQSAQENPTSANEAARILIEHAHPLLEVFDLFFGEQEHFQKELFDEVAMTAVNCLVAYQRKTGDNETFVKLLERALPLAESIEVRRRIEENIGIGKGNLNQSKLDPVYELLKSIQDSKKSPSERLGRFNAEVANVLISAMAGLSRGSDDYNQLWDSAAIVLRGISLDAWNNHQDRQTAVAANELAIKHATSPELKQRLAEDKSTLQQQSTHHLDGSGWQRTNAKEKSSSVNPGMVFLVIVGILVVWGVIGSCNSTNDSPHSTTYDSHTPSAPAYTPPAPSAPTYTPPPASDGGSSGGNVYRVPSDVSSALDREKAGIEADRAVLKQLDDQLDSLGRKIESDRIYLDKTSQDDVDAFNAKVDRYNTLSQQDKAATAAFNVRVDNYNAKLRQYGR
jgi:hypothetical protein